MSKTAQRAAVIIIGSNSTRLLAADLNPKLSHPLRGREDTRLLLRLMEEAQGQGSGFLSLSQAVNRLQALAKGSGAQDIHLLATAALRESSQIREAEAALWQHTGLRLQVISGQEEARYSFLGAVHPLGQGQPLGVVDIGGGSTELALGDLHGQPSAHSLPLGAAGLFKACPIQNQQDLHKAFALCEEQINSQLSGLGDLPSRFLLVGGTGVALASLLAGRLLPMDHQEDVPITRKDALGMLELLIPLSLAAREALPGMTPGRAQILPTGLCILISLMDFLGQWDIQVTTRNNTDGFLYSLARAGIRG